MNYHLTDSDRTLDPKPLAECSSPPFDAAYLLNYQNVAGSPDQSCVSLTPQGPPSPVSLCRASRGSRSHIDVLLVEIFPVIHSLVAIRSGLRALRQIACLHRLPAIAFVGTVNFFRILGDIDLRPLFRYGSPIPCRLVGKMSCCPRPRKSRSRCYGGKNPKDIHPR